MDCLRENAARSLTVISNDVYFANKALRVDDMDAVARCLRDIESNIEDIRDTLDIEE